jgi:uncharacterized protein
MNDALQRTNGESSVPATSPWLFFAVTFAITWTCWLSAVVLGHHMNSAAGVLLLLLGLTGPGVAGIGFVYLAYDEAGRADFWSRVVGVRRIGPRWVLIALAVPLVVTAIAAAADLLVGGSGATWGEGVQAFGAAPLAIVPALFFATLPPLLEELGWRGYALDRLQLNWSASVASMILGAVWALWHVPLFFVEGSFQAESIGFGTLGFWLFMVGIVALSVVFTWVYNHTARSVLVVILLHGWINFTAEAVEVAEVFYYGTWVLLAIVLVAIWGSKTLTRVSAAPRPPLPARR